MGLNARGREGSKGEKGVVLRKNGGNWVRVPEAPDLYAGTQES